MVLDYARQAYRSKMRLWQDSILETEGVWFRAPAGAKIFPKPHLFGQVRTGYRHEYAAAGGVGEVGRIAYYKGMNPSGYLGQNHCGAEQAIQFGGVVGIDPPLPTDTTGRAECCTKNVVCGIGIPARWQLTWTAGSGCECMATVSTTLNFDPGTSALPNLRTYRAGPVGTFPLTWGAGCAPGFGGFPCNVMLRVVYSGCLFFLTLEFFNGLQLVTRDATPQLITGGSPVLFADTDVPLTWAANSVGQIIWDVGSCDVVIGDPDKRWLHTLHPEY